MDRDFIEGVDKEQIIWSSPGSSYNKSFTELLQKNNTCIIAKSVASVLGVEEVGEEIRLTFKNPNVNNDPGNITLFTVVGISGGIPGFFNF